MKNYPYFELKDLSQKDRIAVYQAAKVYEDALQRIITEDVFDEWLDRIPEDVDMLKYASIVKAMLDTLRKYRKPTEKQIKLALDLGFANLKY